MAELIVSPTPNPDSLKFVVNGARFIESGMESFKTPEDAEAHELGRRLFALNGVANVFIMPEFLTVSKDPGADWNELLPKLERMLEDYLAANRE